MAGRVNGVGALILQQYPKATPFWCASHILNLCIVQACNLPMVKNMMGTADEVVRFFNYSSKRQSFLENEINKEPRDTKRMKLKELCRTRWIQRHDALEVFIDMLPPVVDALNELRNQEKNSKSLTDTNGLLLAVSSFQFIVTLVIVQSCMGYIKPLSISLQGRSQDFLKAQQQIFNVRDTLQDVRTNIHQYHGNWFQQATVIASDLGVEPQQPRIVGRQRHRENAQGPSNSVEEYFKINTTIPFLDHLLCQINERFSNLQRKAMTGLQLMDKSKMASAADFSYFEDDLPSPRTLQHELHAWYLKSQTLATDSVTESLQQCDKQEFPNIHTILTISAVLPVTSCECERSISALGFIKSDTRNSMGQTRLSSLTLMFIHRELSVDPKEIVRKYARKHSRRIDLPNILLHE